MAARVLYTDFDEDRILRFQGAYDRALLECGRKNEVSRQYSMLIGKQPGPKSSRDLAHDGRVPLSYVRKAKKVPSPARVWNTFEAFRAAGVMWTSGVVGLHAAEHFSELVGLYYTLGKLAADYEGPLRTLLADVAFAAPASTRAGGLRPWDDFAGIEQACASAILTDSLHAELREAWRVWRQLPRDLIDLCSQYPDFPVAEYAMTSDLRRTALEREMVIQNYVTGQSPSP